MPNGPVGLAELERKETRSAGRTCGVKWVAGHAEPQQLRDLQRAVENCGGNGDPAQFVNICNSHGNGHVPALDELLGCYLTDLMTTAIGDPPCATGFIEGTLAEWEWTKSQRPEELSDR